MNPDRINRYQGRIAGLFDVDVENFNRGDIVMAVVVLKADTLTTKDDSRGDCVGTVGFKVNDFALVEDEILRKSLFHHLPHLEPPEQLFATPFRPPPSLVGPSFALPPTEVALDVVGDVTDDYHDLPDTVMDVDDLRTEDIVVADAEDGAVFNPADESRERGRLGANKDPILQRFLRGE